MTTTKTADRPLYGAVHIYDYEHSGDSRRAYQVLAQLGITDTTFENNGDGNVAYINFSIPYDRQRCRAIASALENAGYGCGYENLWQYESKDYRNIVEQVLPVEDESKSYKERITAMPTYGEITEQGMEDWDVYLEAKLYTSSLSADPRPLVALAKMFRTLGCTSVHYWRDSCEVTLTGIGRFVKVRDMKEILLEDEVAHKVCITPYRTSADWRDVLSDAYGLRYVKHDTERYETSRFAPFVKLLGGL